MMANYSEKTVHTPLMALNIVIVDCRSNLSVILRFNQVDFIVCPSMLGNLCQKYWHDVIKVIISRVSLSEDALHSQRERQTLHANEILFSLRLKHAARGVIHA